jgi:thiol-disulfide isomerase/thioredoxin
VLPVCPVIGIRRARVLITLAIFALAAQPPLVTAQVTSMTAADAGALIASQPGTRVVLLYKTTCQYSHAMFPEVASLADRYSPLGVRFLAFSIDDTPNPLEQYLGSVGYSFERLHIQRWQPGELVAALEPFGIDVRSRVGTPHIAVIDADGQLVGQIRGSGGARHADRWLQSLGFLPLAE